MTDILIVLGAVVFGLLVQMALAPKTEKREPIPKHLHEWVTSTNSQQQEECLECTVCGYKT